MLMMQRIKDMGVNSQARGQVSVVMDRDAVEVCNPRDDHARKTTRPVSFYIEENKSVKWFIKKQNEHLSIFSAEILI